MSTFITTYWLGYKVVVKPHEWQRKSLHYHNGYLPYMNGQQIGIDLVIESPKDLKIPEDIMVQWRIIKEGGHSEKERFGSNKFSQHMLPKKKYQTMLSSNFLSTPDKYIIDFKLTRPNQDIQL
jgi:hypothetical protein